MKNGLWHSLEALNSPAAVLAEWRQLAGPEFHHAQPFLRPTQQLAEAYPCPCRPRCGCRHEVVPLDDGRLTARCHCDPAECPPLALTPADVVVHELDLARFCEAVRQALQLDATAPGQFPGARHCHRVGTRGPAQAPAVLCLAHSEPAMLAQIGGLCAAIPDAFILLTPMGTSFTPRVEAAIRRHGSIHIPLARFVSLAGPGKFTATAAGKPIFAAFDRSLATPSPLRGEGGRRPDEVAAPARKVRYALRKGGGYWTLTFDGQQAAIKHEKGILYVAWLLANPPKEPIHAIDLAAQVPAIYRCQLGIASAVDDTTGKPVALAATARPQERSHGLDDLEAARRLHKKQQELEAVLDDGDATEPEKAEALAELEQVYEFQKKHAIRSKGNAEKLVRAIRLVVNRFQKHLEAARR